MANKRQRKKQYKKNVLKIKQLAANVRPKIPQTKDNHNVGSEFKQMIDSLYQENKGAMNLLKDDDENRVSPEFNRLLTETYQEDKGIMDLLKQDEDDFWENSKWAGFQDSITDEDREWDTMEPVGKEIIPDSTMDNGLDWDNATKPVSKKKLRSSDQLVRIWQMMVAREDDPLVDLDELIAELEVEDDDSQSDFWKIVDNQAKKYGTIDTPEVDWGPDVELEDNDSKN